MAESKKLFRILSIDGGGTRGLIPALLLQHIEKQAGKPAAELFDLIVGTSTGGIIAACLSQPGPDGRPAHSASSLVDVYAKPENTSRIFEPYRSGLLDKLEHEAHRVLFHKRGLPAGSENQEHERQGQPVPWYHGLWHPKYSGAGLKEYLEDFMGPGLFRTALTLTALTSFNIQTRQLYMMRSWLTGLPEPEGQPDFTFVDVARATAAPPPLLPIAEIPTGRQDDPTLYLVDGFVAANDPAVLACAEASRYMRRHPEEWAGSKLLPVSLGTGQPVAPPAKPPGESADFPQWGVLQWVFHDLIQMLLDGPVNATEQAARELLSSHGDFQHSFRFQPPLTGTLPDGTHYSSSSAADDYTPENVAALSHAASWVMETEPHKSELSRAIELLARQS